MITFRIFSFAVFLLRFCLRSLSSAFEHHRAFKAQSKFIRVHLDIHPFHFTNNSTSCSSNYFRVPKSASIFMSLFFLFYLWYSFARPHFSTLLQVLTSRTDFRPKRTLLIAFGHDEEVSGAGGAQAIVRLLQQRHVRCRAVHMCMLFSRFALRAES
jgi:hypothetical protein